MASHIIITTDGREFKFNQSALVQTYLNWLWGVTLITKLDYVFTRPFHFNHQNTAEVHCSIANQYSNGTH